MNTTIEKQDWSPIYRIGKVIELTALSRGTIYRLEACGQFPGRVKLSSSASGWYSEDIHKWIANRPRAGDKRRVCRG
ncbi:MAG: AlpA family phage regulatory protein [Nitrosospira sp.]